MTAQQPPSRQQTSTHCAVTLDGFHRIFRTSRHEATRMRQHRRDQPLVGPQCELDQRPHLSASATRARCAARRRARATSPKSSAKGAVKTLLRGLKTMSTGPSQAAGDSRTASRIRRLIRLRATAPPSTLPTVNPTRGSVPAASSGRRRKNTVMLPVNCRRPF
jgi:hypothetical protein